MYMMDKLSSVKFFTGVCCKITGIKIHYSAEMGK